MNKKHAVNTTVSGNEGNEYHRFFNLSKKKPLICRYTLSTNQKLWLESSLIMRAFPVNIFFRLISQRDFFSGANVNDVSLAQIICRWHVLK
jgi:hypothetical protein